MPIQNTSGRNSLQAADVERDVPMKSEKPVIQKPQQKEESPPPAVQDFGEVPAIPDGM